MEQLLEEEFSLTTVFSFQSQKIDSRFGKAKDFIDKAEKLTGKVAITTIEDAEPVGPKKMFDLFMIAPCTGNTHG